MIGRKDAAAPRRTMPHHPRQQGHPHSAQPWAWRPGASCLGASSVAAGHLARHDGRVVLPVRGGRLVRAAVQRHAAAALLLAQRVAHHGDRLHRRLKGLVLSLDGDDAPGRVRQVRVLHGAALPLHSGAVLLDELLTRVEDDVQHLGVRNLHKGLREPAREDCELVGPPAGVPAAQEALVLLRDRQAAHLGAHKVGDDDVLAEGRVSIDQRLPALLIGFLHPGDELRLVEADARAAVVGVIPLPLGELVQEEGLAHQAGVHRAHWCRAAAGGGGEAAAAVRPRGHHPLVGAARVPASGWAPSGRGDGGEAAGACARSPGQEGRADAGGKQRHAKLRQPGGFRRIRARCCRAVYRVWQSRQCAVSLRN
mmetsp:Transcript_38412/g.98231  ORF Transcript_38412/g.98231 Transcript_38412/m.98231 type:complete len:367 (+) Transcript_38412:317-1417(+)